MTERIQKILSARGVASRREAEQMLLAGRVTVCGRVARLGDRADPQTDEIRLDGQPIPAPSGPVYIMLNKPRGVVTTRRDEKGRPNVMQLGDCGVSVWPVGRLDLFSEGLLLLTNDGELTQFLTHPSHQVDKTYEVWVSGLTPERMNALQRPVVLDGYPIRKPRVRLLCAQSGKLEVTIHEGRNRQVRRMCEMAGLPVRRLRRVQEGSLRLGSLPVRAWRYLTEEEVQRLRQG